MQISDLGYMELLHEQTTDKQRNCLVGGFSSAGAYTFADYGFGFAHADALSIGQSTATLTQTSVVALTTPFGAITTARAKGSALATTSESYHRSEARSTSAFIGSYR